MICATCKKNEQGNLILEARDADGKLVFNVPDPPFSVCTFDDLAKYYYSQNPLPADETNPNANLASQEEMAAWYAERNWRWRPKTW